MYFLESDLGHLGHLGDTMRRGLRMGSGYEKPGPLFRDYAFHKPTHH